MCSNSCQILYHSSSTHQLFHIKYFLSWPPRSLWGLKPPPLVLAPASADSDFVNYANQPTAKLLKAGTEAMSIKFDYKPDNHQLESNQRKFHCNLCTLNRVP
jgi:hypothetical protein